MGCLPGWRTGEITTARGYRGGKTTVAKKPSLRGKRKVARLGWRWGELGVVDKKVAGGTGEKNRWE